MSSRKQITSFLVVVWTVLTILMEHSASGTTPCGYCRSEISMTYLKKIEDLIEKIKKNTPSGENGGNNKCQMNPMDCDEVQQCGHNESGVYTIWPKNRISNGSVKVYCDMDTDEGGWTVIQRRGDYGKKKDYFYKDWKSYKKGFGDIEEDFWLGNDLIFDITSQRRYSIWFDLTDFECDTSYALYDDFWIEDENGKYRLHISNYSGDAGDSMAYHDNMMFSTKDRDNALSSSHNCAEKYKGAWWFKKCYEVHLNGLYLEKGKKGDGIEWKSWKGSKVSLEATEMKIRPKMV